MTNPPTSHVRCRVPSSEVWTWANGITLIRTVLGLTFFAIAAVSQQPIWNFAGLVTYWSLDTLDGFLARYYDQETRLGAQMDILADRLLAIFFYLNFLTSHPALVLPIVLFLFEFMVLDHYLSNQFLHWPILSPNYFYEIDDLIWRLNWSMPAKLLNSGAVTLVLLLTESAWIGSVVVLALISVKLYSCIRLHRLLPQRSMPL
jgi:CDP-diacylglycerol--glycerol-3-phosphate 3-phosphatidyltransferase